jgi:hypothetical protein
MTTLAQTLNTLFIDREGVTIPTASENFDQRAASVNRSVQPFSELKNGKFRRLFNRHSIIR